jgi:proteic killer suppression protein
MVVYFKNTHLGKILNSQKEILRKYGRDNGNKLMLRLQELRAYDTLAMVPITPPTRRHELIEDRKGHFAVDLKHPYRLIFKPAHNPVPLKSDGGIDITKVTEIVITEIVDYH